MGSFWHKLTYENRPVIGRHGPGLVHDHGTGRTSSKSLLFRNLFLGLWEGPLLVGEFFSARRAHRVSRGSLHFVFWKRLSRECVSSHETNPDASSRADTGGIWSSWLGGHFPIHVGLPHFRARLYHRPTSLAPSAAPSPDRRNGAAAL